MQARVYVANKKIYRNNKKIFRLRERKRYIIVRKVVKKKKTSIEYC